MVGLIFDRRVSAVDKMLLAAAIGYAVSPLDLVPDFLPVLGLADDVFFLSLAVHRLDPPRRHWMWCSITGPATPTNSATLI